MRRMLSRAEMGVLFAAAVLLAHGLGFCAPPGENQGLQGGTTEFQNFILRLGDPEGPLNGPFEILTPARNLAVTGHFTDGRKDGAWALYNSQGLKIFHLSYKDDVLDGPCTSYFPSSVPGTKGKVMAVVNFSHGRREGPFVSYRPDGTKALVAEFRGGEVRNALSWKPSGEEDFRETASSLARATARADDEGLYELDRLVGLVLKSARREKIGTVARYHPEILQDYQGGLQVQYRELKEKLPVMVAQIQRDVLLRFGLEPKEGFTVPMKIGFVEDRPSPYRVVRSQLAGYTKDPGTGQEIFLVIVNLYAYGTDLKGFQVNLKRDLSAFVLADALGRDRYKKLPPWFTTGLSIWVSGRGKEFVTSEVVINPGRVENILVRDLDSPTEASMASQYFMAVEYLVQSKGLPALRGLVQNLAADKPFPEALKLCTNQRWEDFQKNVRLYSLKYVRKIESETNSPPGDGF